MKKVVINYFNRTELVKSVNEAVDFINSLQYRGSSYSLTCSDHCRMKLEEFFHSESAAEMLTTTGCATTRINIFTALADTLEEHNKITVANKEQIERERADKAERAHQEWIKQMYAAAKGWYVVTLDVLVSKIKGNDGVKTYSFRILADNQMEAYERACRKIMEEGVNDRNVSFVYEIKDSAKSALIEYVGVWTDESELEYGASK